MAEIKFVVDLGNVKITEEQRQPINATIQKTVAGELATLSLSNKVALFPVCKFLGGGIINGIIVRDVGNKFNDLIKLTSCQVMTLRCAFHIGVNRVHSC